MTKFLRILKWPLSSLLPVWATKVTYGIIASMAGNAAWENFKASAPVVLKDEGNSAFVTGLIVLFALALMSSHAESHQSTQPSDKPHPNARRAVHEGRVMFVIGLVMLAAYWFYTHLDLFQSTNRGPRQQTAAPTQSKAPSPPKSNPSTAALQPPPTHPAATPHAIFDIYRLNGKSHLTALASSGNPDAVEMVTDALAIPLDRHALTPAFFNRGFFDRTLAGESNLFTGYPVPAALDRIVVLKVEQTSPQKSNISVDAIRITERVHIAIVDTHRGNTVFNKKITVDGDGFTEEFARASLKDNLDRALTQAKEVLGNGS